MRCITRLLPCLLLPIVLGGCAAWERYQLDQAYGTPDAIDRTVALAGEIPEYHRDIRPLIESRCTVCHGCYDAPCQLKLDSRAGIERGASKAKVYDGTRLLAANLTRLFIDAGTTGEWRNKGFSPVLNEREQTADANREGSVMHRMLALKQKHPLPDQPILPDSFDFSLDRNQQCTTIEEFPRFEKKFPLWGMPYGLPGLDPQESRLMMRWIETGAASTPTPPLPEQHLQAIAAWETLLNDDSPKAQLSARYIYEHLFYGSLYFSELPGTYYFRLVRSGTPSGEPIQEIATRRPYDHPGVSRVYYRFKLDESTVLAKTHMPYALHAARLARWKSLFFEAPFTVNELPGYAPDVAANPFAAFRALPTDARYRFMLDEAQFIIQGFIKGPVCRGQLALNVIDDRFWILFVDPDRPESMDHDDYLATHHHVLRLPAEQDSNALPLANWLRYANLQREWLQAKGNYFRQHFPEVARPTETVIWNGDGTNPNAALTVFRHFDSATVAQGWIGEPPKTAWVIGYPLLERIHYLLVAGFDVYGNLGHQLLTRMYMDFLRMEGEANFLLLLPERTRAAEREFWYRDASADVMRYVDDRWISNQVEPAIHYRTDNPKQELFGLLAKRIPKALDNPWRLERSTLSATSRSFLHSLESVEGSFLHLLPETALLIIQTRNGPEELFTLLHNSAYKNLNTLFMEDARRIPAEDTLTVAYGVIGAYPNAFYRVHEKDLPLFIDQLRKLQSERDYADLMQRFGVRRSHPGFWAFSDRLHARYRQQQGQDAGLLDYNRLENR